MGPHTASPRPSSGTTMLGRYAGLQKALPSVLLRGLHPQLSSAAASRAPPARRYTAITAFIPKEVAQKTKTDGIQTASFASSAAAAGAIPYTELSVGERRRGHAGLSEGAMPWVWHDQLPPPLQHSACAVACCRRASRDL